MASTTLSQVRAQIQAAFWVCVNIVCVPRIHDLRHTNASWLIHAGIPLPVISDHLGHESINHHG